MNEQKIKLYRYVGSQEIQLSVASFPMGTRIKSIEYLKNWLDRTKQKRKNCEIIPATFIIDSDGYLRLADRHSEHVACAGGESVLSAGEIFFVCDKQEITISEISNQSTGYCPEVESWLFVAKALDLIPFSHPGKFTTEFMFRRCPKCDRINVIKNELFLCAVCNADLPLDWNFES